MAARGRKKKTTEPVVESQENVEVEKVVEEPVVKETSKTTEEWKERGFSSPEAYENFKKKFYS